MPDPTISAVTTATEHDGPRAIVCGPGSPFIDRLSLYLRTEGVAVSAENHLRLVSDAEYAVYIGEWEDVKLILASDKQRSTKTLCVITDSFSRDREIDEYLCSFSRTKAVLTSEYDMTHLSVDEVLSFFFSNGRKQTLGTHISTPAQVRKPPELTRAAQVVASIVEDERGTSRDTIADTVEDIYDIKRERPSDRFATLLPERSQFADVYRVLGRGMIVALFGFLLFVGYPVLSFAGNSIMAFWRLQSAYQLATASDIAKGEKRFTQAVGHIESAQTELERLAWLFSLSKSPKIIPFISRTLSVAQNIAYGGRHVLTGVAIGRAIPRYLAGSGADGLADIITQTREKFLLADRNLAVAEAEGKLLFADYPQAAEIFLQQNQLTSGLEKLVEARHDIGVGSGLLTLLPELTGLSGKKRYLVLFINNMELRPGGGFIGSFGLVTFDQGRMGEISIEDVYAADGQLKGHVKPPFAIRTFLEQENFFLRDSNWDPDFSASAQKAAWFLQKEMGIDVDGVLAIDLTAVSYLLSATGPIDLPDYDQRITSENLFTQAQAYAQSDFFPGSTQKRDFLGALGRTLLTHITFDQGTDSSQTGVMQKLSQALEEKHVLVYFADNKTQAMARNLGFGGTLIQNQCVVSACLSDYLYLVDANLGVNKANYFVKRAVTNVVSVSDDAEIFRNVIVLYRNDSPADQTYPAGAYRNYLRAFVPLNSRVRSVEIDGKRIKLAEKETFEKVDGIDPVYFVDQYKDKTSIELYFEVLPEGQKRIAISYALPSELPVTDSDGALYNLTVQKQPGTDGDLLRTIVEYPSFWRLVARDNPNVAGVTTLAKEGRLEYNGRLGKDLQLQIRLAK